VIGADVTDRWMSIGDCHAALAVVRICYSSGSNRRGAGFHQLNIRLSQTPEVVSNFFRPVIKYYRITAKMQKPGKIEKLESHIVTQSLATLAGALSPAAAILPVLLSSAANARMQARIDEALGALQEELTKLRANVDRLSDAQYKVVCEALSHLQRTNDEKKIEYLKRAILNGVLDEELSSEKAYIVSRVLRDISALEIEFLLAGIRCTQIYLMVPNSDGSVPILDAAAYTVATTVSTEMIIAGLLSLGLIAESGAYKTGYVCTPVAFILVAMLK
jgi:hypothetical protein